VNAKVLKLSSKIDKLKSNSVCNNDLSQEYMQNMVQENKSLKAENDTLKQRCENLVYAMVSLKANVSDLEEEKKSLPMVIKVLQTDANLNQPENNENRNGWQNVKGRAASGKRVESLSASKSDMVIRNQFEILSDSDIEIKSQEIPLVKGRQKVINKSQGQTNKNNDELQNKESARPSKAKVPSTVIIGDSMTKHLDSRRLQQSSKNVRRVSTQTFRGATIEDMKHHIRPCLARKPREIILHVGTNDLAKKNPQEIVNGIADIVNIIHVESPATKPVLSEIMMRTDSSSYIPKIGKINQQLQSYCQDQNIDLIQHGNLQANHLNSYGVHLNRAGSSIFAKNLIGYFNKDSGN
jgi:lysophospholipase L1-like esterase/regulator of replication initiation timing